MSEKPPNKPVASKPNGKTAFKPMSEPHETTTPHSSHRKRHSNTFPDHANQQTPCLNAHSFALHTHSCNRKRHSKRIPRPTSLIKLPLSLSPRANTFAQHSNSFPNQTSLATPYAHSRHAHHASAARRHATVTPTGRHAAFTRR